MPEDEELTELREQTSHGDRIDEAETQVEDGFVGDIIEELEAIESGEQQKTISVWDGPVAAFIRALEENPQRMTSIGNQLQQQLGLENGEINRSEVLRLALRHGFEDAAPGEFEAVREAMREQATKRL